MRTAFAFLLGAAIVSATWSFAGPTGHPNTISHPAPHGPAVSEGLGQSVPNFGWQGPGGEGSELQDLLGDGPLIVAIRDVSCPVSQRYGPTLETLEDEYAQRGVRFLFVDLTPDDVGWNLGMPREQAKLDGSYVRHVDDDFFAALHPQTTTEVFLLDGSGVLRYRGAIDDQFGIDFVRQSPRSRFLEGALHAVLAGDTPEVESTFAPGCYLPRYMEAQTRAADEPTVVARYGHDVQTPVGGS